MATTVYTTEEVELQDGTLVTLKPLNIKGLRKFMRVMEGFAKVESEEEGLEIMIDAAAICLAKAAPQFYDSKKGDNGGASEEFEDVIDMPTIYKILDVCGGVKLNDPNLQAAAAAALGTT